MERDWLHKLLRDVPEEHRYLRTGADRTAVLLTIGTDINTSADPVVLKTGLPPQSLVPEPDYGITSRKPVFITLSLAVTCYAQQQTASEPIPIIRYDNEGVNADGSYQWSLETGNGIVAQEKGQLKDLGEGNQAQEVEGSYQYTANDGTPIQVSYLANENGFQPQGEHLPTPPPVPAAIQRALEFIEANPQPEDSQL